MSCREYDTIGQVGCLAVGTNRLQVGNGRSTTTDARGGRVEVVIDDDLVRQAGKLTPQDSASWSTGCPTRRGGDVQVGTSPAGGLRVRVTFSTAPVASPGLIHVPGPA